jgi:hypothetical protein
MVPLIPGKRKRRETFDTKLVIKEDKLKNRCWLKMQPMIPRSRVRIPTPLTWYCVKMAKSRSNNYPEAREY